MNEIWKDIVDFEDKYQVSNLGKVRSKTREVNTKGNGTRTVKGKVLKQQINHRGYSIIGLSSGSSVKSKTIHQLVFAAFTSNFSYGTELNHKDGNKQNNALTNLELSGSSHNQLHAVRTGLKKKPGISRFRNVTFSPRHKKKWIGSIYVKGKNFGWKSFMTEEEAAHHVDYLLDSIGDTERLRNFP